MKFDDSSNIIFQEKQFFRHPVLWSIMILCIIASWHAFARILLNNTMRSVPEYYPCFIAFIWFFCGIILPLFLWKSHLNVVIRSDGLYYRFQWLQYKTHKISMDQILSVQACTFHPILDFGGWGIRIRRKLTAYTVSGNKGVRITLRNGNDILLGSLRAEEMESALAPLINIL